MTAMCGERSKLGMTTMCGERPVFVQKFWCIKMHSGKNLPPGLVRDVDVLLLDLLRLALLGQVLVQVA